MQFVHRMGTLVLRPMQRRDVHGMVRTEREHAKKAEAKWSKHDGLKKRLKRNAEDRTAEAGDARRGDGDWRAVPSFNKAFRARRSSRFDEVQQRSVLADDIRCRPVSIG